MTAGVAGSAHLPSRLRALVTRLSASETSSGEEINRELRSILDKIAAALETADFAGAGSPLGLLFTHESARSVRPLLAQAEAQLRACRDGAPYAMLVTVVGSLEAALSGALKNAFASLSAAAVSAVDSLSELLKTADAAGHTYAYGDELAQYLASVKNACDSMIRLLLL